MPSRNHKGAAAKDSMIRRMEATATLLGADATEYIENKYPGEPRWRIDARWIEFECGCRCERVRELFHVRSYDPIVFKELPEMAVYDFVCHFHNPAMNARVKFGGFVDFKQWHRIRRPVLMSR